MQEQLVSFETAKMASEKGFNYMKANVYGDNMAYDIGIHAGKLIVSGNGLNYILAPTQSLLQKWLREKYHMIVWIEPLGQNIYECNISYENGSYSIGQISGYEEALEEGLQEGLKLIN